MTKRTIPEQVADALKRKEGFYIDRDTQTIHYRGPGNGTVTCSQLYSAIQDQMDHNMSLDDALDITDRNPIIPVSTISEYQMINGYSLSDDTIERITDSERLIR